MNLADSYDAFLLDLDGVVWRGEEATPAAAETITELRRRGKRVVFVTNNSSRSTRDYAVKLMRLKVPTATNEIVTSGHAVLRELRRIGLVAGDRVHVCGGRGLVALLAHEGLVPTTETTAVKALVVGWNPKIGFEDVRVAADLAREGLPFIASNADATYPAETGLLPGTGAFVAAIETASGRRAKVVGKPAPELIQLALETAGSSAERALFCGDRPETDVAGARAAGVRCALVLTGVVSEKDLGHMRLVPDEILDDLSDLLREVPEHRIDSRPDRLAAVSVAPVNADGDGPERGAPRELAALGLSRNSKRSRLTELQLDPSLDVRSSWRLLRRLLVEALSFADGIEASPDVQPYLERLGVSVPQGRLFG